MHWSATPCLAFFGFQPRKMAKRFSSRAIRGTISVNFTPGTAVSIV